MKYISLVIFLIIAFFISTETVKEEYNYMINPSSITEIDVVINEPEVFYGTITGYGPDCEGCIGITASGYDVRNTIYYYDEEYGQVRVLAADRSIPFGTIIKINDLPNDIISIVLDRGSAIGYGKGSQADLLFASEDESYDFGRKHNIKFEILRLGY